MCAIYQWLSWLPVSFLLHVKYTLSYRIVSYRSVNCTVETRYPFTYLVRFWEVRYTDNLCNTMTMMQVTSENQRPTSGSRSTKQCNWKWKRDPVVYSNPFDPVLWVQRVLCVVSSQQWVTAVVRPLHPADGSKISLTLAILLWSTALTVARAKAIIFYRYFYLHTLVWKGRPKLVAVYSLSGYRYLGDVVKFCTMVHIGPGQIFSPFGGGSRGTLRAPKSEIFGLNFGHLTANISKTVSRMSIRA